MPRSRTVDAAARRAMLKLLARIGSGRLELSEPGGTRVFGQTRFENPLTTRVEVRDPHFYTAFFRGSLGLAESYIGGEWECDDLTAFVRIGARNMPALDRARAVYRVGEKPARMLGDLFHDHVSHRDRTARHYNLGNDLYEAMLDETMAYSSAVFTDPAQSLADAQAEKFDRVCRKLRLTPRDRLVEIGTGWGGFAIHAASHYGCHVTTTTIASAQSRLAQERVRAAGLEDRIEIVERDFAQLEGRFDKLASIEMIESIGWRRFDEYFKVCSDLLEDDGLMCLQVITIDDRAYEVEKLSRSFMNTLIFDGGSLPSNEFIAKAVARHTDLQMVDYEDITAHYPETLRRWRSNFNDAFETLRGDEYDERFLRLWNLYLAYCEAGFIERRILVGQSTYAKPAFRDTWEAFAAAGDAELISNA